MAVAPARGYECEFVNEVHEHFKCPICENVLRDPHRVSCCDEEYCKECIEQALRDHRPCSKCGTNDDIHIGKSKKTKRCIDNLMCYCTNRGEGCEWEGELLELDNHLNMNPVDENQLNGCDLTRIGCRYCNEMLRRNEMGEHQENTCQNRPFNCEHCGHHDTYERVMTNHLPECPQQPVLCPQECGLSPKRMDMDAHKANDCPKTTIKCEIQGCEERRLRRDMPAHNEEYAVQHTQLLSQKVRELEEEAQQKKREQNARYLPITLTMTDFEQHLDAGDLWTSRLFYTQNEGYALYLTVYAGGYGIAKFMDEISVYVHIARGEYDDQLDWPCQVHIQVSLLNQQQNEEHLTKFVGIRAERTAKRHSQGWPRFAKQRNVQQQFVKDNCLKFRVSTANN